MNREENDLNIMDEGWKEFTYNIVNSPIYPIVEGILSLNLGSLTKVISLLRDVYTKLYHS